MTLFTYTIPRDFGFAPNPFYGYCTLATCKPRIRSRAKVGDWIIGTGSVTQNLEGELIYAMQVTEKMTFDQYWSDERFLSKRPFMGGSLKQMYGDNIYHHVNGIWAQENSHHSNGDGTINMLNLNRDTGSDNVLISDYYYYFGGETLTIPPPLQGEVCWNRINHKEITDLSLITRFLSWLQNEKLNPGMIGDPKQFSSFQRYKGN